jgi:hypothetical protein
MKQEAAGKSGVKRGLLVASMALGFGLSTTTAVAAENLNPHADEILRSMSSFLAGTRAFSVSADISNEFITLDAQKLQLNSYGTVLVERPSRFYTTRNGKFADAELIYDGRQLTVYSKTAKDYVQKDLPGTIDQAIAAIEIQSGLSLPGADLLLSNPYAVLSSGITSSAYYGRAFVGGVQCHHLAFRTPRVDWQIWVKDGAESLPMKYVITSKWMAGAPQYSVELSNWNVKPVIAADRFKFTVPSGAKKVEGFAVDETGEFIALEEGK